MDDNHVQALHEKHGRLDRKIHEETCRPIPDSTLLARLKKQKLKIKEQLYAI